MITTLIPEECLAVLRRKHKIGFFKQDWVRSYVKELYGRKNATAEDCLSQLLDWFSPQYDKKTRELQFRTHHFFNGELWVVKSYEKWKKTTNVSESTIRRALTRLEEDGIIRKEAHLTNNRKLLHLTFNFDRLMDAMVAHCSKEELKINQEVVECFRIWMDRKTREHVDGKIRENGGLKRVGNGPGNEPENEASNAP